MASTGIFQILHSFPEPNTEREWREFLAACDVLTHYTSPEFFREPFFRNKRPFVVLAKTDGRIDGVLTGLHEGKRLVSGLSVRPQICFRKGVDQGRVAIALAEGLRSEGADSELITLFAWSPLTGMKNLKFSIREEEGVVMLDLARGPAALLRDMSSTGRNEINFAAKRGIVVHEAEKEEDFRAFYDIHAQWCQKRNSSPVSYEEWREAFSLRDNRRLFLASSSGRIIAGSVVRFAKNGYAEYAANNSLEEFLQLKPNVLLNWRAIEWAHAQGLQKYSLGACGPFHRKFGKTIVPTYRHRLDKSFLRKYDLRDRAEACARTAFSNLPGPLRKKVKAFVRRNA